MKGKQPLGSKIQKNTPAAIQLDSFVLYERVIEIPPGPDGPSYFEFIARRYQMDKTGNIIAGEFENHTSGQKTYNNALMFCRNLNNGELRRTYERLAFLNSRERAQPLNTDESIELEYCKKRLQFFRDWYDSMGFVFPTEEDCRQAQQAAIAPDNLADGGPITIVALPTYVFKKKGDHWVIRYDGGDEVLLRDRKGLRYLSVLLANPKKAYSVADLWKEVNGLSSEITRRKLIDGDHGGDEGVREATDVGSGIDVLDDKALAAYRKRLKELTTEREEAEGNNDLAKIEKVNRETEGIKDELGRVTDKHGKIRMVGETSEKKRKAISKAITDTERELRDHSDTLYEHLCNTVKTGSEFCYNPEKEIKWDI